MSDILRAMKNKIPPVDADPRIPVPQTMQEMSAVMDRRLEIIAEKMREHPEFRGTIADIGISWTIRAYELVMLRDRIAVISTWDEEQLVKFLTHCNQKFYAEKDRYTMSHFLENLETGSC